MTQYNIDTKEYIERNNNLFETSLPVDSSGNMLYTRGSKSATNIVKSSSDYSLFHGKFTFDVTKRLWEEYNITFSDLPNYVFTFDAQSEFSNATSEDNMLSLKSGTTVNAGHGLWSKSHYSNQPARGQLYSTTVFCPNPEYSGFRSWGMFTPYEGIRFFLEGDGTDWELFAFRKSGNVVQSKHSLNQYLDDDFDPSNGHNYQIQFDLSGVGNIYYFIDEELIYTEELKGSMSSLAINDPSLAVAFSSVTAEEGTELELKAYSVDVTIEGGREDKRIPIAISTGSSFVNSDSTDTAVLALRVPRTITYNSDTVYNTKGVIGHKAVVWCRDEAEAKIYAIRDVAAPNLEALTWDSVPDSNLEYLVGGDTSDLNTAFTADVDSAFMLVAEWQDIELKNILEISLSNLEFRVAPGDIVLVVVNAISENDDTSATMYLSEDI